MVPCDVVVYRSCLPCPPDPPACPPQYVNNATLADVTFVVEGRTFHAHRIALLASSDAFRCVALLPG